MKNEITPDDCPACGYEVQAVSPSIPDYKEKPKAGDITMCVSCGYLAVFGRNMRLRRMSKRKLAEVMNDPEVQLMVKAHADVRGDRQQ